MHVRRGFHEDNIVLLPYKRTQHCCATLHRSQNNRNVDDDDDSLLHIFALKINYIMFTLAIRKNIKIYTLQVYCEKLQLLQLLRNIKRYKFKFKDLALFKR